MDAVDMSCFEKQGYSSSEALIELYSEILEVAEKFEQSISKRRIRQQLTALHHNDVKSSFHWPSCIALLAVLILTLVSYSNRETYGYQEKWLIVEACLICFMLIMNIYFALWQRGLKHAEYVHLVKTVLKQIKDCLKFDSIWSASNYPHLCSPISPCVSLQWTLRDGEIVNVPTVLLVKGDIILLRPGQEAPAKCRELEEVDETQPELQLNSSDVYSPELEGTDDRFSSPQGRSPVAPKAFILLETPFLNNLNKILADVDDRPASILENERFNVCSIYIQRGIVPIVLILVLITNILRYSYLPGQRGHWTEVIIMLQLDAVLPLLPIIFPIMWTVIDLYGLTRLFLAFQVGKEKKSLYESDTFDSDSIISEDEARIDLAWKDVFHRFCVVFLGRSPVVSRKINAMHTLGALTSFCCIDKKGILSWPNPSAEKVLLFTKKNKSGTPPNSRCESDSSNDHNGDSSQKQKKTKQEKIDFTDIDKFLSESHTEVLDLTHDAKSAFGLQFDDPTWKKHLNSLKPLGLNILANTCNHETYEWYTQFADHVACAALQNDETVAVVNRRCLCELAKQIGFTEPAMEVFSLDKTLGVYKHVSQEEANKERLHRARSFTWHKIPMPNMVSVIVKEKNSGMCQLLSQGTGDILLDCCSDYWNGEDLSVLKETERKKILEFYHRQSMTSYCTSFSYRPLARHISSQIDDQYIELPDGSRHLYAPQRKASMVYEGTVDCTSLNSASRSFSFDSLMENESMSSVEDVSGLFQAQCNQIFIGMVTMQYQAMQDFVQLIDKLEKACIRFVHFSQENEIRSRVFSEKMGLEAGWNCHISLLSQQGSKAGSSDSHHGSVSAQGDLSHRTSRYSSRHSTNAMSRENLVSLKAKLSSQDALQTRCHSAPSFINFDSTQVKFERLGSHDPENVHPPTKHQSDMTNDVKNCRIDNTVIEFRTYYDEDHRVPATKVENGDIDDFDEMFDFAGSHQTSSCITDDSYTAAFDNRAKLPSGIENIRPHLNNIDNVPLLVNLFTDCTPETTQEMIRIMQEHGEVVVCLGSSMSIKNTSSFLQADCSIAIEPLYPQVCAKLPVMQDPWTEAVPRPTHVASTLLSIPCPLSFRSVDNVSLIQLIAEARHHILKMRNCFQLMLCCCGSLTVVQVLASLVLFPPVLATQHLLWVLIVIIPLLCITLVANAVDPRIMSEATGKNRNHVSKEVAFTFVLYYLMRFLPSLIISLVSYGLVLKPKCVSLHSNNSLSTRTDCDVYSSLHIADENSTTWYEKYESSLIVAQNLLVFQVVLSFVSISVCLVYKSDHLWQKLPVSNRLWLFTVPTIIVLQLIFCVCDVAVRVQYSGYVLDLSAISPVVWVLTAVWPLVTVAVCEIVKKREIKLSVRYQKREKLNFGTKLGMNSPF